MKILSLFLFCILAFDLSAKSISGVVLSIHDGDTITIMPDGAVKKAKVRLLGVDTPEIDFNGHTQGAAAEMARETLKLILPLNAQIKIELPSGSMDSNGRYLGQIFYKGVDINLEMLKMGMGAVYFIYPYDKKMVVEYHEAAELADLMKVGIFSPEYSQTPLPYMFRQNVKGVLGTNLIADYQTKKLFTADRIEQVLHYRRVFFSSEETALIHGFNW